MSEKNKIKLSPKLVDLCKWEYISQVNEMLDSGESPNAVCKWINKQGFKISTPLIYDYFKIRQQAVLNGVTMEKILGISINSNTASIKQGVEFKNKKSKLRKELDALDKIIDMGYSSLDKWENKPIPITILMQAIKLKNELTEGYYGGLTPYGMEQLTLLEKQKYEVITEVLMQFIPDDLKEKAIESMSIAEEEFYKESEFYEDYLRASGLTEDEIRRKLDELDKSEDDETVIEV